MLRIIAIALAAAQLGACFAIIVFMPPLPPHYTGWERNLAAHLTGISGLLLAFAAWVNYPTHRRQLIAAILLAMLPTALVAWYHFKVF